MNHTFVIVAYKESPYLERCIESLKNQYIVSKIIITTSTPSLFLENICNKYNLNLKINPIRNGIASDWDFALNQANTKYVTLAHQDDVYFNNYTKLLFNKIEHYKKQDFSIMFPDYYECDVYDKLNITNLLRIKRVLLFPAIIFPYLSSKFAKKSILLFGSSISCPGVTYNLDLLRQNNFKFDDNFTVNLDWKAWYDLSSMNGSFLFVNKRLFAHRIHSGAETTYALKDSRRQNEDKIMFRKFWHKSIVKIILKLYSLSYKFNK